MPKERTAKRGDIVELVDGTIGMIIGWIDNTYFAVLDLKNDDRKRVVGACENTDVARILVKVEELQTLDFLPKEIKLSDTQLK